MDPKSGECRDVNECQLDIHDCPSFLRCDNTFGSYECIRVQGCGTGYTIDADTDECEDIDECALDPDICSPGSICRNKIGSFICEKIKCQPGESVVNETCKSICGQNEIWNIKHGYCVPRDPCLNSLCSHECHSSERMNDNRRFYHCSCRSGFELSKKDGLSCVDIDECQIQTHNCPERQWCRNTFGSFVCDCPNGFERSSPTSPCMGKF